jgi:hypothetical protein
MYRNPSRNDLKLRVVGNPLHQDPRFESLFAKAETHQRQFRPNETKRLEASGQLMSVLRERTQACWETLKSARKSGLNLIVANEIAMPNILLPDEDQNDSRW